MILKHLHSIFTSLLWSKKFKNALFLEGYQHSPSVSAMTENKKCRQKSKQIEATKDVSVEFSENNLGKILHQMMKQSLQEKKMKTILCLASISLNSWKRQHSLNWKNFNMAIEFFNLFSIPFMQGLGQNPTLSPGCLALV